MLAGQVKQFDYEDVNSKIKGFTDRFSKNSIDFFSALFEQIEPYPRDDAIRFCASLFKQFELIYQNIFLSIEKQLHYEYKTSSSHISQILKKISDIYFTSNEQNCGEEQIMKQHNQIVRLTKKDQSKINPDKQVKISIRNFISYEKYNIFIQDIQSQNQLRSQQQNLKLFNVSFDANQLSKISKQIFWERPKLDRQDREYDQIMGVLNEIIQRSQVSYQTSFASQLNLYLESLIKDIVTPMRIEFDHNNDKQEANTLQMFQMHNNNENQIKTYQNTYCKNNQGGEEIILKKQKKKIISQQLYLKQLQLKQIDGEDIYNQQDLIQIESIVLQLIQIKNNIEKLIPRFLVKKISQYPNILAESKKFLPSIQEKFTFTRKYRFSLQDQTQKNKNRQLYSPRFNTSFSFKQKEVQQFLRTIKSQVSFFISQTLQVTEIIQILWFIGQEKEYIMKKIQLEKQSKQSINKIQQNLAKAVDLLLTIRIKNNQICRKHKKEIFYIHHNSLLRQSIYLCNDCILENKQKICQKQQILCRKHNKIANYKADEFSNFKQLYLCQPCILQSEASNIYFISECHYQIIVQFCTQQTCIVANQFKICPSCPHKHQNHKKVNLSEQSFYNQFMLKGQIYSPVEQKAMVIKEALKLTPISKIIDTYFNKIQKTIKFLESFTVCNNKQMRKLISRILKEARREDMLVLWGTRELKELNQNQRLDYLETFQDLLSKQIQIVFRQITESLQHFTKKINFIQEVNSSQIDEVLSQKYESVFDIQNQNITKIYPCKIDQININNINKILNIQVNKDQEYLSDDLIEKRWIDFKIKFFNNQIDHKINQPQQFLQDRQTFKYSIINGTISNFTNNIINDECLYLPFPQYFERKTKQIGQCFNQKRNIYRGNLKKCLPIIQIIILKLTNLRVINIIYKPKMCLYKEDQCRYVVSAFHLFKVVHENSLLVQVTLKGIEIVYYEQFMKYVNPKNQKQVALQQEQRWIRQFRPLKSLKLSINASATFYIQYIDNVLIQINNLAFFRGLFHSVSDIKACVNLNKLKLIYQWGNILLDLWSELKNIKKIKLKLKGYQRLYISAQIISIVRFVIFEKLAQFTQIASLQFSSNCEFGPQVPLSDFQSIQYALKTLFQNNQVDHLIINDIIKYFPKFPKITTLQQIQLNLYTLSFPQQVDFIGKIVQNNPQLKSIKCNGSKQKWKINDELINKLQTLTIINCSNVVFDNISPEIPSNIQFFHVDRCNLDESSLSAVFPKLFNLKYLSIGNIDFGSQLIISIPSPHLEQLHIVNNNKLTNKCLKEIDQKQPYLKILSIRGCQKVDQLVWKICKFKGLMQLEVDSQLLGYRKKYLKFLRAKGIRVNLFKKNSLFSKMR